MTKLIERRFEKTYHLLPGDTVTATETRNGITRVEYSHVSTEAESIRIRIDKVEASA